MFSLTFFYFGTYDAYLIYSPRINKYYIGQTIYLTDRLARHNENHYSCLAAQHREKASCYRWLLY
jgi:hypothetical protein